MMKRFVEVIIENATKPTMIKPFPRANRFGLLTRLIVMDEVPSNILVKKEESLDFWNEIEGFFLSNKNKEIMDFRSGNYPEFQIPDELVTEKKTISSFDLFVVGDRIIDSSYTVYKVYGFINGDGSSNIYFDVK